MKPLGVCYDKSCNDVNGKNSDGKISSSDSKVGVFVVKTNEELMIARQVHSLFVKTAIR